MSVDTVQQLVAGRLDLEACAREPIHIPGTIQPYGLLLVIEPDGMTVIQRAVAQRSIVEVMGDPLGKPLSEFLGNEHAAIADQLVSLQDEPVYLGRVTLKNGGPHHAIAQRVDGLIQLELEEAMHDDPGSLDDLYPVISAFLTELERAPSVMKLCELAAPEIRRLTGLDRVLIYSFDEEWNGNVIAEDRNETLPSYLGLRFPASDIPAQARELYRLNRVRVIADCNYQPVPIEPTINPLTGHPTDLSLSNLRAVSPVHLQYMRNMGTGASMSMSLLRDGKLWGLISCHNQAPLRVPYHVRKACDFLGRILSMQIAAKDHAGEVEQRMARRVVQIRLLGLMAGEEDFLRGLERDPERLLSLTQASGAAIVHQGRCVRFGHAPEGEQISELVQWLDSHGHGDQFHTNTLAKVFAPANAYKDIASGVLAVSISQLHASYVLWFRPEVIQTVRWGGDPRKPVEGEKLSPRTSFDAWKETVQLHSLPWGHADVDAAVDLRSAIVDIVLRTAEEKAELNDQLVRSNKELEAFSYSVSHDLRAPFRHIVGYSQLLIDSVGGKLSDKERRFVATIVESANSAGTLVDDLLSFSQMGRSRLGKARIDMAQLVAETRKRLEIETHDRNIEWNVGPLPVVEVDPPMLMLVFQNLFSNAIKFTVSNDVAKIGVTCETNDKEHIFCVADNGCGFDMRYVGKLFGVFQRLHHADEFGGTGIGLANVRRIIERHQGRTWAEGTLGQGARFYFSLPLTSQAQT